ncbi:hypothetical protein [Microbacterium sp. 22296]|uniref:hypothetical protein n=1 Tax=Microbacterium sp. 22296 TaxID=3453903 RepID=UPI003F879AAD
MGYSFPGQRVDLGGGRGWLDRPHADSIFRIDREIGHLLQITEAGRTWDEQNAHFQTYLRVGYPIALSPDTPSVHQEGGAIDSNEAQQMQTRMEDHGWRRTVYRWVNGVWTLVERWHYERFAHLDNHRNDPALAGGNATPISEEDDMFDDQARQDAKDRHAELMTALEKVHRAAAPYKIISWGTGLIAVNPMNGKFWILPAGYSELLQGLGYTGGSAFRADDAQLGFATGFLPATIGDTVEVGGDGFTDADLEAIKTAIAQAQVAVTPEQLQTLLDTVGAAARDGGEEGAKKALQELTFVVTAS